MSDEPKIKFPAEPDERDKWALPLVRGDAPHNPASMGPHYYPTEEERNLIARGLWPVRTITREEAEEVYPPARPSTP